MNLCLFAAGVDLRGSAVGLHLHLHVPHTPREVGLGSECASDCRTGNRQALAGAVTLAMSLSHWFGLPFSSQ